MPILADEKGEFVLRFSFGRSIWETFRPEQFDLETKPESHQNFVSDSVADFYQIGGDILMERSGKILFCYRSHSLLSEADELKLLSMVELHKSQWDSQKAKMSRTCVIS